MSKTPAFRNGDPRWDHWCDSCIFLGRYGQHDLYFCPRCDQGTLLARFGNRDEAYMSLPVMIITAATRVHPALAEAAERARRLGCLPSTVTAQNDDALILSNQN